MKRGAAACCLSIIEACGRSVADDNIYQRETTRAEELSEGDRWKSGRLLFVGRPSFQLKKNNRKTDRGSADKLLLFLGKQSLPFKM